MKKEPDVLAFGVDEPMEVSVTDPSTWEPDLEHAAACIVITVEEEPDFEANPDGDYAGCRSEIAVLDTRLTPRALAAAMRVLADELDTPEAQAQHKALMHPSLLDRLDRLLRGDDDD